MGTHPDEQVSEAYRDKMTALARVIDEFFNGDAKGESRHTAFVLLISPFGDTEGRVNYVSNGDRRDILTMMKEVIARFEGQPELKGQA
jgi:hypothetical protein